MDILRDKIVTTRKNHYCDACFRKFPKGSKMRAQVNTFDGIGTWRTCLTCSDLIDYFNYLFADEMYGCVMEGCVHDEISNEHPGLTPEDLLVKLKKNEKGIKK